MGSTTYRQAGRELGYESISRELLQRSDLGMAPRGLLALLLSLPDGWDLGGVSGLTRMLPEGGTAIASAVEKLEALGLLARVKRQAPDGTWDWLWTWGQTEERVQATVDQWLAEHDGTATPDEVGIPDVSAGRTTYGKPEHGSPTDGYAVNNRGLQERSTQERKDPPIPPASGGRVAKPAASLFEEFWSLYPLRTGKQAARRAWDKAVTRSNPAVIIKAALLFAEAWDRPDADREFIPHPSTWLNQGRYEDEAPQVRLGRNGRPHRPTKDDKIRTLQSWKPQPPGMQPPGRRAIEGQ
jgi:hypothetical protein